MDTFQRGVFYLEVSMRVKIVKEGTGYEVGSEIDFNNRVGAAWVARGLAVEVPAAAGPMVQQTVAADQSGVVGGLHTGNAPVGG